MADASQQELNITFMGFFVVVGAEVVVVVVVVEQFGVGPPSELVETQPSSGELNDGSVMINPSEFLLT